MSDFYILTLNHGFGYYKSKCGRQVQVNACALRSLFFIVIAQLLARPAVFGTARYGQMGSPKLPSLPSGGWLTAPTPQPRELASTCLSTAVFSP